MGSVWAAEHTVTGKSLALKFLHPRDDDGTAPPARAARGPGRVRRAAPEHPRRARRARGGRRLARAGDGPAGRRVAPRPARPRAHALARRYAGRGAPRARRARRGARGRRRAPRPQAGQPVPPLHRRGEDPRLRRGQADGQGRRGGRIRGPDGDRRDDRHSVLHGAGAGLRGSGRRARRSLGHGRDPVRVPLRRAAHPGREPRSGAPPAHQRQARAAGGPRALHVAGGRVDCPRAALDRSGWPPRVGARRARRAHGRRGGRCAATRGGPAALARLASGGDAGSARADGRERERRSGADRPAPGEGPRARARAGRRRGGARPDRGGLPRRNGQPGIGGRIAHGGGSSRSAARSRHRRGRAARCAHRHGRSHRGALATPSRRGAGSVVCSRRARRQAPRSRVFLTHGRAPFERRAALDKAAQKSHSE